MRDSSSPLSLVSTLVTSEGAKTIGVSFGEISTSVKASVIARDTPAVGVATSSVTVVSEGM